MRVSKHTCSAEQAHQYQFPSDSRTEIACFEISNTSLVMGSAQRPEIFDQQALAKADIDLVKRSSGGGAVFVDGLNVIWVDVFAPKDSPLWHRDLAKNFEIVGGCWQRAFSECGMRLEMVTSSTSKSAEARLVCWAGIGWGELVVGNRKILGLSQRRNRWGARVQGMAVLDDSVLRAAEFFTPETLKDSGCTKAELISAIGDYQQLPELNVKRFTKALISQFEALLVSSD